MKNILILAGASGVGKTTLAMKLLSEDAKFSYVRSATTRAPRGDGHDAEYIYLSKEEFSKKAESGEMLEWMEYGGKLYGTPRSEIDRIFSEGKTPLLVLDLVGVEALKSAKPDFGVFAFYIYESLDEIEKRLYQRELGEEKTVDGLEAFMRRKTANIRDYLSLPEKAQCFDAFIKNESGDKAVFDILSAYAELSCGAQPQRAAISEIAAQLAESAKR